MAGKKNGAKGKQMQNNKITKEERKKAYIMFLNLYWEWLNTEKNDQFIVMQEGVERLGLKKPEQYKKWNEIEKEDKIEEDDEIEEDDNDRALSTYYLDDDIDRELSTYYLDDDVADDDSAGDDSAISTSMFDEYVTDVYLSFFDKFNGFCQSKKVKEKDIINAFIKFIHKSWNREERQFNQIKEKFLERVFNEWDEMSNELTDEEFDKFVEEELQKRKNQYIKIRDRYDKKRTWFYSMEDLFFKLAQLEKSRRKGERRRAAALESIDDENFDEQKLKDPVTPEDQVITHDRLAGYMDRLDDTDKKIAHLRGEGYNLESIAKEVGLSPSTVSRRLKKMYNFGKE